jgi:hypothetical protein
VTLASTGRMMFPNVLDEPAQQFKAGFRADYVMGVDERWKDRFGVWIVRTPEDLAQGVSDVCTGEHASPRPTDALTRTTTKSAGAYEYA